MRRLVALAALLLAACASSPPAPAPAAAERPAAPTSRPTSRPAGEDDLLARVASIHGAAGPFAVAGARMGRRALAELGLERGDFAVRVEHSCPQEVQWSCLADGLQAATGASPGKLNLVLLPAPDGASTVSRVVDTRSGRWVELRLTEGFRSRFLDLPRERLVAAGHQVAELPDEEIFTLRRE